MAFFYGRTSILLCLVVCIVTINTVKGDIWCEDVLANCKDYAIGTCKNYPEWAATKCAKTCGICSTLRDPKNTCVVIQDIVFPKTYAEQVKCEKDSGCLSDEYSLKCGAICTRQDLGCKVTATNKNKSWCNRASCPRGIPVIFHKGMYTGKKNA